MEKWLGHHTWEDFKAAFETQFVPEAFKEAKRVEFERLVQGNMTVAEYEKKFLELAEYCPYTIPNDDRKKKRFLDGLSDVIASGISGAAHPTFKSLRNATYKVERQRMMRGSRRRSYKSMSSGTFSQDSSKRGSYSFRSSGGGGRFRGGRQSPSGYSGQRSGRRWRPNQ